MRDINNSIRRIKDLKRKLELIDCGSSSERQLIDDTKTRLMLVDARATYILTNESTVEEASSNTITMDWDPEDMETTVSFAIPKEL